MLYKHYANRKARKVIILSIVIIIYVIVIVQSLMGASHFISDTVVCVYICWGIVKIFI